jgi:oligopeptide transport system ATP-binding protein
MNPVLEVRDLELSFGSPGQDGPGLSGINLSLAPGRVLGVVGESGSGKTSLARALVGLRPISEGHISLMGQALPRDGAMGRQLRRQVQMIFQNPVSSLNPRMTILQSLEEPLRVHEGHMSERERRDRAMQVLDLVGLPAASLSCYPHQFSGGQCQRIAIARALMVQPSLLICDEVVSALDVSVQAQVLNLLMTLQRDLGLAMVFISHDLAVVRHICDEVAVIYRGRLLELGPALSLCAQPAHPYTRDLLAAVPGSGIARRGTPAVPESPVNTGCVYRHRCELATTRCVELRPDLSPASAAPGGRQVACHHPLGVALETMPGPGG